MAIAHSTLYFVTSALLVHLWIKMKRKKKAVTGGYYSDYFHGNKRGKSTCGNKTVLIHARMPRLQLARMNVSPTAH